MYESVAGNVAARFVESEIKHNSVNADQRMRCHKAAHAVTLKFAFKKKPGRFTQRLKAAFPALQAPRVTEWTKDQKSVLAEVTEGVTAAFPDIRNDRKPLFVEKGIGLYRYYFGDNGSSKYANPAYMSQHAIKRCLHRDAFSEDEIKVEVARCLHLAACVAEHVPEGMVDGKEHISVLIPYRDGALCALIMPDPNTQGDDHFGPSFRKISCVIRTYLSPCMIHDGGARRLGLLDCILEDSVTQSRSLVLNPDLVKRVGSNMCKWTHTPTVSASAPENTAKVLEDA